jgi:hypothetical protein
MFGRRLRLRLLGAIKMRKYKIFAEVISRKFIGEIDAKNKIDALNKAWKHPNCILPQDKAFKKNFEYSVIDRIKAYESDENESI